APDSSPHPLADFGWELRLRLAGRLAERGIRAHLFVQSDLVRHLGVSLLEKRPEQSGASLLRFLELGVRTRLCGGRVAAFGGRSFRPIRARGVRRFAGVLTGSSSGGADLSGVAPQFSSDRPAEESRVCGFGNLSGTAVPELGTAGERLA